MIKAGRARGRCQVTTHRKTAPPPRGAAFQNKPDNTSTHSGGRQEFPNQLELHGATRFLEVFAGESSVHLVAMQPDGGPTASLNVDAHDGGKIVRFIQSRNRTDNIYFTVNDVGGFTGRKASTEDVVAIRAVPVDIDPPADGTGDTRDADREVALAKIEELELKPSVLIDSGRGYQPFYLFDNPLALNAPTSLRVQQVGRSVAALVGGDNVSDLPRVMRLPGTVNHPGESKRKRGYVKSRAKVIYLDGPRYGL